LPGRLSRIRESSSQAIVFIVSATAFHCPTCGAAASGANPRSCAYCGTRLATIQCARCFGAMFDGSKYCPHCGAAGAQKRATDLEKLPCPRCRSPRRKPLMAPSELHDIHFDECAACGGVWIDHPTFARVCDDAEAQAHALNMLGPSRGTTERGVRYVKCPLCDQQMGRRNYARQSGVIVDFCPSHGLWFDHDELRRIVEFVRTGGLDEARRAEAQRLASEGQRRRGEDSRERIPDAMKIEYGFGTSVKPGILRLLDMLLGQLLR
jgi:Zn-finger nucleic acid-binding protein